MKLSITIRLELFTEVLADFHPFGVSIQSISVLRVFMLMHALKIFHSTYQAQ